MDVGEYDTKTFRLARIEIPKSLFNELVDTNSDLRDDVCDYILFELFLSYIF